jgi:DNA-binding PadR family transcriptional regulator
MTGIVRSLSILALLTMVIGLLVGTAMGLSSLNLSKTAKAIGKTTVDESMELLLKSGFIRGIITNGRTHYEITDSGRQFLEEYQELNAGPEQTPPSNLQISQDKQNL